MYLAFGAYNCIKIQYQQNPCKTQAFILPCSLRFTVSARHSRVLQSSKSFLSALGARVRRANSDAGGPTFERCRRALARWTTARLIEAGRSARRSSCRWRRAALADARADARAGTADARTPDGGVGRAAAHSLSARPLISHGAMLEQLLVVRARTVRSGDRRSSRRWSGARSGGRGMAAGRQRADLTSFQTLRRLQRLRKA